MSIEIKPEQLRGELIRRAKRVPKLVHQAAYRSAVRSRALLAKRTPVDLGQMKSAWRAHKGANGELPSITNDAPHAGIIEGGARPHPVSKAGQEAIAEWVRRQIGGQRPKRKMKKAAKPRKNPTKRNTPRRKTKRRPKLSEEKVQAITRAIVEKLRREGQEGKFIVYRSLDELGKIFGHELGKRIQRDANRKAKK